MQFSALLFVLYVSVLFVLFLQCYDTSVGGRASAVGIATGWATEGSEFESR
jgi:hypothetical protein